MEFTTLIGSRLGGTLRAALLLVAVNGVYACSANEETSLVEDGLVEQVADSITSAAQTGKIGDGKVFVIDVEKAVRIRTGETDDEAL